MPDQYAPKSVRDVNGIMPRRLTSPSQSKDSKDL